MRTTRTAGEMIRARRKSLGFKTGESFHAYSRTVAEETYEYVDESLMYQDTDITLKEKLISAATMPQSAMSKLENDNYDFQEHSVLSLGSSRLDNLLHCLQWTPFKLYENTGILLPSVYALVNKVDMESPHLLSDEDRNAVHISVMTIMNYVTGEDKELVLELGARAREDVRYLLDNQISLKGTIAKVVISGMNYVVLDCSDKTGGYIGLIAIEGTDKNSCELLGLKDYNAMSSPPRIIGTVFAAGHTVQNFDEPFMQDF